MAVILNRFLVLWALAGVIGSSVFPSVACAARMGLSMETVRKDVTPIVLAEITDSKSVTLPPEREGFPAQQGYAISLRVHEVLRGTLKARKNIKISFSSKGYSNVWEFDTKPEVGKKVLVYLFSGRGHDWKDYGLPGTFVALETFNDPYVTTIRKTLDFWHINDPLAQRRALESGCFDDDAGFSSYCISLLEAEARGGGAATAKAHAFLWEVFTDSRTSLDSVLDCDNFFWNEFRSLGWNTFEPRYEIISNAVRRHLATEKNIHHNLFDQAITVLCMYPTHRVEVLSLLMGVVNGKRESYKFGAAMRIGLLYEIVPTDREANQFNAKILACLHDYILSRNDIVADGASCALGHIHECSAQHGLYSESLRSLIQKCVEEADRAAIRSRLEAALGAAAKLHTSAESVDPDGTPPLITGEWSGYVGKRIRLVGNVSWERTDSYGVAVEVNRHLVWLPEAKNWRIDRPAEKPVLLSGILDVADDMPVFRYKPGDIFGVGLPVPESFDLNNLRRRYLLRSAEWKFIEKSVNLLPQTAP